MIYLKNVTFWNMALVSIHTIWYQYGVVKTGRPWAHKRSGTIFSAVNKTGVEGYVPADHTAPAIADMCPPN